MQELRVQNGKVVSQLLAMFAWACILIDSTSYYMPYLFLTVLAFICFYINNKSGVKIYRCREKNQILVTVGAIGYSLIFLIANYQIWYEINYLSGRFVYIYRIVMFVVLALGGFYVAFNILHYFARVLKSFFWEERTYRISSKKFLFICFMLLSAVNIIFLITCEYPGNMSSDSFIYIKEVAEGFYTNKHPFYHAVIINGIITIGMRLFGNMNLAVALYSVIQIMFMALCFSIVGCTFFEMKVPLSVISVVILWYILMPFHIVYSFTMWKNVPWGGFITLYVVYVFRILQKVGKKPFWEFLVLSISGLGCCLFSSNGFFVFLVIFIVLIILFRKEQKSLCISMVGIMFIAFLLKYPVLSALGIVQADTVEKLSIPLQQVSRVIIDHDNDFTDDEKKLLDFIVDRETIKEIYQPYISDPVKNHVRNVGALDKMIQSGRGFELIKLYVCLAFRHPGTYVKAWIDQTCGFWNGGYPYWRWDNSIYENEYGIEKKVYSETIKKFFDNYLWIYENNRFLQTFLCIGFYVWIDVFLCFINIIKRNKVGIFLSVPALAIILSLVITSPVFAEFRYVYAIFCSLPFVVVATFIKSKL